MSDNQPRDVPLYERLDEFAASDSLVAFPPEPVACPCKPVHCGVTVVVLCCNINVRGVTVELQ